MLLLLKFMHLLLHFVGVFVFHLFAQSDLNLAHVEELAGGVEACGHGGFEVGLHVHLLGFVIPLQQTYLLGNPEPQSVHPIVPLHREFLKLLTIVKLDLFSLLLVLANKAVLDALLSMLADHLDVLKLGFGVLVEALVRLDD